MCSWQNKYCVRITFISNNHKHHSTGEAAGLIEPLDKRVAEFLRHLIRQGTKNAKDLQSRALEYVKESLFLSLDIGLDVTVFLVKHFFAVIDAGYRTFE